MQSGLPVMASIQDGSFFVRGTSLGVLFVNSGGVDFALLTPLTLFIVFAKRGV